MRTLRTITLISSVILCAASGSSSRPSGGGYQQPPGGGGYQQPPGGGGGGGTQPVLSQIPPGQGWTCTWIKYASDGHQTSLCYRSDADCRSDVSQAAASGQVFVERDCGFQPQSHCYTYVKGSTPDWLCYGTMEHCLNTRNIVSTKTTEYFNVSYCGVVN